MEGILVLFAYLIGSIPTGILLTKGFSKQDPRTVGSRNIGATNIYRTAGKTPAVLTLAGDTLKGFVPVALARCWHFPELWVSLTALAVFLGHLFPIFLRFKGGKGVATALGLFLALAPWAVAIDLPIFCGILATWRIVSLASMTAAAVMPILVWISTGSPSYLVMSMCVGALIVYRHRTNIQRLLAGQENRFKI